MISDTLDTKSGRRADAPARWEPVTDESRPGTAGERDGWGAEHEARGLMNVITLVSHCLDAGWGTEGERRQWRREIEEAAGRLRSCGWRAR